MKQLRCGKWFIHLLLLLLLMTGVVFAQEQTEYLKYQEPQPPSTSFLSTISYVLSLILTFLVIIGLAYFTSRVVGQRMSGLGANKSNRILSSIVLGPNRSINVVDVAGKVLIIGVTEHNICLLQEVKDEGEIEKLRAQSFVPQQPLTFDQIFQRHLTSLSQMSNKFPAAFGCEKQNEKNETNQEKR